MSFSGIGVVASNIVDIEVRGKTISIEYLFFGLSKDLEEAAKTVGRNTFAASICSTCIDHGGKDGKGG